MDIKNVFREHFRLMSPIELCLCLESEELLRGFSNLEPGEQMRFLNEFDQELVNFIELYQKLKTRSTLTEPQKTHVV